MRPNDPYFSAQWGLRAVRAADAWCSVNTTEAVVAVLDTGVDWQHPDLKDVMWTRQGPVKADEPERFNDVVHGYDFYNDKSEPMDRDGHGTHCAGIIGAFANNRVGVAGVASRVRIMALKVMDPAAGNKGNPLALIEAIEFAANNGARVINASWEMRAPAEELQSLSESIRDAGTKGVLFVAAAGNDHVNTDRSPRYPASFSHANILAVASVDALEHLSFFSNFGKTSVHIAAPGGTGLPYDEDDILSTISTVNDHTSGKFPRDVNYAYLAGTSMAAPHVAGSAALVLGHPRYQNVNLQQLRATLLENVRRIPALEDACVSQGVLDLSFLKK